MKKITKKDVWKNFDIRFELKEKKDNIQLLVYLDNELAFATRKDAFARKEITYQKIKLNKWHLPQFRRPGALRRCLWKNRDFPFRRQR